MKQEPLDILAIELARGSPRKPLEHADAPAVRPPRTVRRPPQIERALEPFLNRHDALLERDARLPGAADHQGRRSSIPPQSSLAVTILRRLPALRRAPLRVRWESCRASGFVQRCLAAQTSAQDACEDG